VDATPHTRLRGILAREMDRVREDHVPRGCSISADGGLPNGGGSGEGRTAPWIGIRSP